MLFGARKKKVDSEMQQQLINSGNKVSFAKKKFCHFCVQLKNLNRSDSVFSLNNYLFEEPWINI